MGAKIKINWDEELNDIDGDALYRREPDGKIIEKDGKEQIVTPRWACIYALQNMPPKGANGNLDKNMSAKQYKHAKKIKKANPDAEYGVKFIDFVGGIVGEFFYPAIAGPVREAIGEIEIEEDVDI